MVTMDDPEDRARRASELYTGTAIEVDRLPQKTFLENATISARDLYPLPTGTAIEVDRLPQLDIIHLQSEINHIAHRNFDLQQKIDDLQQKIDQIEKVKIVQFENNDVYEVNKRIERLEVKVASINSKIANSRLARFMMKYLDV